MAALDFGAAATGQALSQGTVDVALDVDVSGNDARTVASVENCGRIDSSGTNELEIDVVLADPGIPADVGIKAWQFDLVYDESVVTVTDEDPELLLAQAKGSDLFTGLSDPLPDSDGSFISAAAEFGAAYEIEPEGVQEVGPGVIVRITLSGVSKGITNLTLGNVILVGADDNPIPTGSVLAAAVSVDQACQPPPPAPLPVAGSPTAPDAETPPGTPGAETPPGTPGADTPPGSTPGAETPPGSTPGAEPPLPGTPGAGPDAGATPAPDGEPGDSQTPGAATPGPGTAVLGGTPVSGDEGGAGGEAQGAEETNGDGLSAGAWAGIGVGIAAAVLAASGAGWFALRQRRARGTPTSGGEGGSE